MCLQCEGPGSIDSSILEWKWQPTLVFLSGEFYGQGRLVGYSPWSHKELDSSGYVRTSTFISHSTLKEIEAKQDQGTCPNRKLCSCVNDKVLPAISETKAAITVNHDHPQQCTLRGLRKWKNRILALES